MAYSVSVNKKTVFGDQRVHFLSAVADAATQAIITGMQHVNHADLTIKSAATIVRFSINKNASGVSANGTIAISGATSGDEFFITVYGN